MFAIDNIRWHDSLTRARGELFLAGNPDPGVRSRPRAQLELALESGQGLLATDGANVCGISLVYKFDVPPSGPVFSEIGTMRVTANGFGLQRFLAWLHLVQIWLEEFEDVPPAVFAVVAPDTASEHNLRIAAGMEPWQPPGELALLRQSTGVPFAPSKRVLRAGVDGFRTAFSQLRSLSEGGRAFRTPKGDEVISVEMGWFDPDVLSLKLLED